MYLALLFSCVWHYYFHVFGIFIFMCLALLFSCVWHCYFHVFDIVIFMCLTLVLSCVWHCCFHVFDVSAFMCLTLLFSCVERYLLSIVDIIAISCYVQTKYTIITFSYPSRIVVFSLWCFVWNDKNIGLVYFQLHTLFSITCSCGYQLYPICRLSLIFSWSYWIKEIDKKMIKIKILVN